MDEIQRIVFSIGGQGELDRSSHVILSPSQLRSEWLTLVATDECISSEIFAKER